MEHLDDGLSPNNAKIDTVVHEIAERVNLFDLCGMFRKS